MAAGIMLFAPLARADEADDLKRRADEALVSGRAAEALAGYKEAYSKRADPALVYNMGRAHQALGEYPVALERLEQFEREAPPELRARVPGLKGLITELRAKVSQLTITCDVAGATVRLDDRTLGQTPLANGFHLNAGKSVLEVTKEGYYPQKREVILPPGGLATVDIHLASKQTEGVLLVQSEVVGALVAVDGKSSGTVPTELVLPGGPHRVQVTRDGYRPATSAILVTPGERRTMNVMLEAEAPITKKWWFWSGVGLVAVGATITVIALTTEKDPGTGTLPPGRVAAGLSF